MLIFQILFMWERVNFSFFNEYPSASTVYVEILKKYRECQLFYLEFDSDMSQRYYVFLYKTVYGAYLAN